MTKLDKQSNHSKTIEDAEKARIGNLLTTAIQESVANGGDIEVFSKSFLLIAIELECTLHGDNAVSDNLIAYAKDIATRGGKGGHG